MKIVLPTSWNGVTINQFNQLSKIQKLDDDDNFDIVIEILHVLSEVPRPILSQVKLHELVKMYKSLDFINELNFSKELQDFIKIDKQIYKCEFDLSKMNANQYMSLKNIIKSGNIVDNIHEILAIFFIPIGKKFNEISYNKIAELFYTEVSIDVAYPLAVFFCNLYNAWMCHIAGYTYTKTLLKKSNRSSHSTQHLTTTGGGI